LRAILHLEGFSSLARNQNCWFNLKDIRMGGFNGKSGVKYLLQSLFLLLYILKVCAQNIYETNY